MAYKSWSRPTGNALLTRSYSSATVVPGGEVGESGTFNPTGIESELEFGEFSVTLYAEMTGIASAEAFSDIAIAGSGELALIDPILSLEEFGLFYTITPFHPDGIESEEAFGAWGGKTDDHPDQTLIVLRGGPFDNTSIWVTEPWPRDWVMMEDEDNEHYTYWVDVDDTEEPFTATYATAAPATTDDTDPDYQPVGEKGDQGEVGETGPEGAPGVDGADFLVALPEITAAMTLAGWAADANDEWIVNSSFDVVGYEPFGYRYEGNYLVCKGVAESVGFVAVAPFVRTVAAIGGPILLIDTDDDTLADTGYAKFTGSNIHVTAITPAADKVIAGWDGVRFALPWPIPQPPV